MHLVAALFAAHLGHLPQVGYFMVSTACPSYYYCLIAGNFNWYKMQQPLCSMGQSAAAGAVMIFSVFPKAIQGAGHYL